MVEISWIDLFLRHIPEGFLIILAGYAVAKKEFSVKLYVISSIVLGVANFLIKLLPVSPLIHMVLAIVLAIVLLVAINKIKPMYSIISTIICFVLTLLSEGLNVILLGNVLKLDTNIVFQDATPLQRTLYGMPSLFIFALVVIVYFIISQKKTKNAAGK